MFEGNEMAMRRLPPHNLVCRKRVGARNSTVVTIDDIIGLWPTCRVIVTIKTVGTQENLAGSTDRRLGNEHFVGRSYEILAVEEDGADFAVCSTHRG
jgi:hypothetical protein